MNDRFSDGRGRGVRLEQQAPPAARGERSLSEQGNVTVALTPAGISQRDYTQHYQHIYNQQDQICSAILDFFQQHVQYKFLDEDCEYALCV